MSDTGRDPTDETKYKQVKKRPRWWLIALGVLLLVMPCVGMAGTVFSMIFAFESIATSPEQPKPADLAESVRMSLILTSAGLVLAAVGVILIAVGFVFRRRVG